MPNKNYRRSHGLQKGFLSLLRTKISNVKKMFRTKDLTKCKIIEQEFKTYQNNQLKLTRASKFNDYITISRRTGLTYLKHRRVLGT